MRVRKAVILAIANRKGGTGKTTVAVNLAAEFAALGRRVLLIDLDSQGHCAFGLGIKPSDTNVHRIFTDPKASLSQAIQPTALENLWLAPADTLFDHGSGARDDDRLRGAIATEGVSDNFDIIIIDTPPSLDTLLINGLMAADRVLVPYVPHPLSFEGVRQLVRVLFKLMSGPNRKLKLLGFLPTMAAEHIRQHRAVTGDMTRQFGPHRVLAGVRTDIRLAEAFAAGRPIRYYAPKSRGAKDFAMLATSLVAVLVDHVELSISTERVPQLQSAI